MFKFHFSPSSQNVKLIGNIEYVSRLILLIQHKNNQYKNNQYKNNFIFIKLYKLKRGGFTKRPRIIFKQTNVSIEDGMDENISRIPKLQQSVKRIDERYAKTYLCGIPVYREGLYSNVCINFHHKYESNQVITSIMHLIVDI